MSLTSGQARFAKVFAAETGLDPKVVGAWLLAEQSGSAAQFYQRKGYNNWLNIARTDSGDKGGAHGSIWSDPDTAARVSAQWMRGEGPIAQSYGKPASGIMAILNSAGQGPHRQIQAISRSGWASSGYNGGATLSSLLGQVGNITASGSRVNPNATERPITTVDQAGLAAAQQQAAGIRGVEGLFPGNRPGDVLLREALEKAGQEPTEQQFTKHSIAKTPGGTFLVPGGKSVQQFDGKPVAGWIAPILKVGRERGWKGTVNSGVRTRAEQEHIYNSGVRPAAKPGTSNHEGTQFPRGAVDVSDPEGLARALKGTHYEHLLVHAGAKDPPHFSHPHGGSY